MSEKLAMYIYNGPADEFAKNANAPFVRRGEKIELTDQEAVIAQRHGHSLTLLREEAEAAVEDVGSEAAVEDYKNADDAESPAHTRKRR